MKNRAADHFWNLRILVNWSIFIIYGVTIFVLSSMPLTLQTSYYSPQMDKLIHAVEFGLFSVFFFRAIQVSFLKTPVLYLILITVIVSILYGALDEYHQFFTPFRTADVFDLLADAVGVLVAQGVILGKVYLRTI
jgi:VanZ family protein